MKKTITIRFLLILLLAILLCTCSKTKKTTETVEESREAAMVNQNYERDYFLCPYWFEYINNDYQIDLDYYINLNNREKVKSFSLYTLTNDKKRLEQRLTYDGGLLTKWESFPSEGDDYAFVYIYDEKGRIIRQDNINARGDLLESRNYSYSYENDKLVCNTTSSYFEDTVYTEEIVDNSFHITRTKGNSDPANYFLIFNNDKLQKFTKKYLKDNIDEYFFTYSDNNIHVKTYCEGELNRQQEWIRDGDTVNYYSYYGESRETGKSIRKDIFKDFDRYDNWLTNIEEDGTTYIREFEYID